MFFELLVLGLWFPGKNHNLENLIVLMVISRHYMLVRPFRESVTGRDQRDSERLTLVPCGETASTSMSPSRYDIISLSR